MDKISWIREQNVSNLSDLNTPQSVSSIKTINKPFVLEEVSDLIPSDIKFKIQETQTYKYLLEAIAVNNPKWINDQMNNLLASGLIPAEIVSLIQEHLNQTIQITEVKSLTLAEQAGYTPVTIQEWEEAINV